MKWTSACLVSAGVLAVLAPGCSGSVKNPADDAGDAGSSASSGTTSIAGSVGLGGGSHTSPAGGRNSAGGGFGDAGHPGGAGSDAGSGGSIYVFPPGDAGAGGVANDSCDDENGNGCIIEYGADISALAADESAVYWVTHGTVDALGNYQNDGRLFKRESGSTKQLASGLAGPVGLGLTSTHFYVYLDQAWDADGQYALARIPVGGGSAAIIQRGAQPVNARADACPNCFVHSGSAAFFPLSDGIYKMDSADTAPTRITDMHAFSLTSAGQFLYFEGGAADADQIWRTPLLSTGSQPERIAATPSAAIQAVGDHLYGVQSGDSSYFTSMPVAGSMWTHLSKLHPGAVHQLDIDDASYFYDLEVYDQPYRIYTGLVETASNGSLVLSVPRKANVKAWVGTAGGLYWTDGHSLRFRTGLPE